MSQLILHGLIWAFSFWMVADCLRRRKSPLWVVAILLIQPYGAFAYVVYLKWSERRRPRLGVPDRAVPSRIVPGAIVPSRAIPSRAVPSGTAPLVPPAAGAPAVEPLATLDVADQLEEQGRFSEASHLYRRAQGSRKDDPRALHGLARCLVELEQSREAIDTYEALMAIDPRYRGYSAALEYAEALHRAGRTLDAAGLLDGMVEETGRLNHRLALAHYWEAGGQTARARGVLESALAAYAASPAPEQEANRRWHRRISDKLEQLAPS